MPHMLGLIVGAIVWCAAADANAQTRVALVVGNSTYTKVPRLANPVRDAEDVAGALRRLGFTVNHVQDVNFDTFRRALLDFNRAAPTAEIALIYFAGHGIEIEGENWLLPTDVELRSAADASTEAISLRSAMQAVATARTLGLVILDACRNNPFQSTMQPAVATRRVVIVDGLAPVEPAENVLVAYAARDGTAANDGVGRNSPFTAALLRHLETPGLEVDFLFRNVRDDVKAATNNEQQPFVYGSLSSEEIYLKPPLPGIADTAKPDDASEIAWSFLKATGDAATLTRFTDRFPASPHVAEAKMRIGALEALPIPASGGTEAVSRRTNYLNEQNGADFENAEKAVARRFLHETPAIEEAWDFVKESADHRMIRRFVDEFPSAKRRVTADKRLADLGQRPITVKVQPYRPLSMPQSVYDEAAKDPEVLECYRVGDQNDRSCQLALQRFPDISRFAESLQFLLNLCGNLGKPSGCLPTVMSTWNFPASNRSGSSAGNSPDNSMNPEVKIDRRTAPTVDLTHRENNLNAFKPTVVTPGNGIHSHALSRHAAINAGAKLHENNANLHETTVKLHETKLRSISPITSVKGAKVPNAAPTVRTANVKVNAPNVKVNAPNPKVNAPNVRVNVRVPTVAFHVH
jgi:hypothetical protein